MIAKGYKGNFETIQRAFRAGQVALMECTDKATGKPVIAVCAVHRDEGQYVMTPLARMFDGNPYEELEPPQ